MKSLRPFILGIEGLSLTKNEQDIFRNAPPFGIILFLRNIDNPNQLNSLMSQIEEATSGQTMMFVDQEGGRVQRLAPPYWPQYPIARDFSGLKGDDFERAVYALYRLISDDLVQAGFHVNCAPCLDLRKPYSAMFLMDRSFGTEKTRIIQAGHASVHAMNDAGIAPVLKHLPGHGRATVDSHLELPQVVFEHNPYSQTPDDVAIFQEDYGVDMAMNAHILYPQIDGEFPLTLSSKGIDYIKNTLGFKGLIMSDDLAMKALRGTQGQLAKKAFTAGLDVALACSGKFDDIKEIYEIDIEPNELVLKTHKKLKEMVASRPPLLKADERDHYFSEMKVQ